MDQNERRERLIESYLRGLTEHLGDLEECLRELGREREELEWEGRDLDSDSRRPRRSGSGCSAISRRYRACATGRCAHP
jgi:hypothetical protein